MSRLVVHRAGGRAIGRQQAAEYRRGGDDTSLQRLIWTGGKDINARHFAGYRTLRGHDPVQLELAGTSRHDRSHMMPTILVGRPDPRHIRTHSTAFAALQACKVAARSGTTFSRIFNANASVLKKSGWIQHSR